MNPVRVRRKHGNHMLLTVKLEAISPSSKHKTTLCEINKVFIRVAGQRLEFDERLVADRVH